MLVYYLVQISELFKQKALAFSDILLDINISE